MRIDQREVYSPFKRTLSALLCCVMCFSLFQTVAFADSKDATAKVSITATWQVEDASLPSDAEIIIRLRNDQQDIPYEGRLVLLSNNTYTGVIEVPAEDEWLWMIEGIYEPTLGRPYNVVGELLESFKFDFVNGLEINIVPQKNDQKVLKFIKKWESGNYTPSTIPAEVKLLLKNSADENWSYPITLTAEAGWTFSLDIPDDIPDMEGLWRVEEVELPTGVKLRGISQDAGIFNEDTGITTITFYINNELRGIVMEPSPDPTPDPRPEYDYICVNKVWVDNGYRVQHTAITAVLYRDGVRYKSVVLDESNGWKYTWKELNEGYVWRVEEETVPEGYIGEVLYTGDSWTIENTLVKPFDNPQTGDSSDITYLLMLAGMSFVGLFVIIGSDKKKKCNTQNGR